MQNPRTDTPLTWSAAARWSAASARSSMTTSSNSWAATAKRASTSRGPPAASSWREKQLDGAHGQPVAGQTPAHVQVQGDEPGDVGHEDHAAQGGAGRAGVQGPHRGVLHHQGDRLHAGFVRTERGERQT